MHKKGTTEKSNSWVDGMHKKGTTEKSNTKWQLTLISNTLVEKRYLIAVIYGLQVWFLNRDRCNCVKKYNRNCTTAMESITYHRGSLATALRNAHIMQKWLKKGVVIGHSARL